MAETVKTLAQLAPSATTLTDVYTVPSSTSAVISSIQITNRGGTDTTFRLAKAIAGAANDNKQYLYYDQPISANSTFEITMGLTMAATDVLRIYAGNGNLSVNVNGVEIT